MQFHYVFKFLMHANIMHMFRTSSGERKKKKKTWLKTPIYVKTGVTIDFFK